MHRAVFFDRDGVLNEAIVRDGKPYPPATLNETRIMEGAETLLPRLRAAGFLLLVVTNQPDIARGAADWNSVASINDYLRAHLPLDAILVCPHDDADHCECRKPNPGLLLKAAVDFDVALDDSYMIGDRWKDIEAGMRAGCKTIWINRNYQERGPKQPPAVTVLSLAEAVDWIMMQEERAV